MNKLVLVAVISVLFSFAACHKADKKVELDPVKRGSVALDVQYAAQDAFMQNGADMGESIIVVLTKALDSWPENTDDNCKKALSLELSRWTALLENGKLSDADKKPMPDTSKLTDFRYQCRSDINYQYDKKRSHDLWGSLVAN